MRRSRRLNGLKPDTVPEPLKAVRRKAKKAPTQHKSPVRKSSSKKENVRPSRSARKPKTPKRASKTPTRSRSGKRAAPKTAPKRASSRSTSRGRKSSDESPKATQTRSRSRRSSEAASQARKATPKKTATRSRSAKRSNKTKTASSIHRKTPKRTPGGRASRRAAVERALSDASEDEEVKGSNADTRDDGVIPFSMDDEDEDYTPETDEMEEVDTYEAVSSNTKGTNHSMDLTIFGIVICLIALYMLSFCRAMSCSAVTKLPWFSTRLTDFDEGATAVTTFLLYVVAFVYCRSWLRSDGFLPAEEGAFVTLHFVHGLLLVLHLLSCSILNPNSKQTNCIQSMVALSIGFYAAAWMMQLKFTIQFLRNSLTLCYLLVFYYYGKNAFGLVLLLAAKSVFWMCGAHMMDVVHDERWSMIDLVSSVGCVFLAYVVPSRM